MVPALSVIVIGYSMSEQLQRTLLTLAADYQQQLNADDYEVIVVENSSADNLAAATVAQLPANFRYFLREEPGGGMCSG